MAVVYHWKHGWIPLDHTAALQKAKGNHDLAAQYLKDAPNAKGITSRQHVAKAALDLPNLTRAEDRTAAAHELHGAAQAHGATELLPRRDASKAAVHGVSSPFSSASQLSQAWDKVRGDILEKHGHPRDLKSARLATGSIALDMQIDGRWVHFTSASQVEMRDIVRLREGKTFRLRAAHVPKNTA